MKRNPISKGVRAIWNMKATLPLAVNLMADSRVERANKLVFLFVTIGYLLFPFDFIFDFPLFGHIDDLAILLYMLNWFITKTPKNILDEYGWDELADQKRREKAAKKREKEAKRKEEKNAKTMAMIAKAIGKGE